MTIKEYKELINKANAASEKYYNTGTSELSDAEFDSIIEQITQFENETGTILSNSPTQNVGAKILNNIPEVTHKRPMLSLDKCHSAEEVFTFAKDKPILLMTKCDGMTIRLTYENGKLLRAESRGDGIVGGDITEHAKQFLNIPLEIKLDHLIVDGEALILDDDFAEIGAGYMNSRNLTAGTLASFDTNTVRQRRLSCIVWDIIEGIDSETLSSKLYGASCLGFDVVPTYYIAEPTIDNIKNGIEYIRNILNIPADGVVIKYDNVAYGESLGRTEHHFKNGIAWKPEREISISVFKNIEWETTRTGAINPVAVFDPVLIQGSMVQRATLHNVSFLRDLELGIGDRIEVFKSNMIIPKIQDNLTRSNTYQIPKVCPSCGAQAEIHKTNNSEILYCSNEYCPSKKLSRMVNFVGKSGMDIEGLSEKTLEPLMNLGWINNFYDIYQLNRYKDKMKNLSMFGHKSVENLVKSIEKSKDTDLAHFITALGISYVGSGSAKTLANHFKTWDAFIYAIDNPNFDFGKLEGFGLKINNSLHEWYLNHYKQDKIDVLAQQMRFKTENNVIGSNSLQGKIFVITGSVYKFKNRNEAKLQIEAHGGKVTGSITNKTSYLVCNDVNSTSSKMKKARELGVEIITEDELINLMQ